MPLNTKIRGAQIADAVAGSGLSKDGSDNLQVNVDNSSIEIVADTLQVKALGITNDMLAGSIADGKLASDYIQTSEVDDSSIEWTGSQLQVKALGITNDMLAGSIAGSKLLDDAITEAKLAMNDTPNDGEVITWNATGSYMEWTPKTSIAEDYIQESEILKEDESANCDGVTTDFTLSSTPVANSVQVFLNGLLQQEGSGKDYTLSGTTVSFVTAPASGDILLIYYIAT